MIDSQALDKLKSIDDRSWANIYKELVLYSSFKLKKAGFVIRSEKDSVDPEHFVTVAIEKTFEGVRKWDFIRFPDITIHLKGVVKSLISSHFKSSNRSIVNSGQETNVTEFAPAYEDEAAPIENQADEIGTDENPELVLINNETLEEIEKAFGDDNDSYIIFCEWLEGSPPRDIAEAFEIPVTEIYNAIKKGKRTTQKLFNKRS